MNRNLVAFLSILFSLTAMAADWPSSRNDRSNSGYSSETIVLPLVERWHSSAPDVEENGAVVSNGVVYMSSEDGFLYAFDVATGADITGFPVATAANYGAPAVDAVNQKVYVLAGSQLYAFNLDGTSAWTRDVGSVGGSYNQGPVIDAGYLYFNSGSNLHKYDSDGNLQWSKPSAASTYQPALTGDHVYVNSEAGQIRKYLKSDGSEITVGGFPVNTGGATTALVALNDKLFHFTGQLYARSAIDGSVIWAAAAVSDSLGYNRPAVANGVVYFYGTDSKVYAFDADTGAPMAGFPSTSLGSASRNWSAPTVAGDLVFVGAGITQELKVLGAAGSSSPGVVLASHPTFSTDQQGFDICSPVVSDGVVFAMLDGGGLYAFFSDDNPWTGGAVVISANADCTDTQNVTLTLDRGSNTGADQMRISEDPFFAAAVWEPYATSKSWVLSAGFGTKTVYVQFRVGTSGPLSNVFNDQIEYAQNCGTASTTLTLQKTVVTDNGGTAVDTDWTLSAAGPTPISGVDGDASITNATVAPGVYTLSESGGPSGYTAGDWSCTGGSLSGDQLTLTIGQSATCGITNDDVAPAPTPPRPAVPVPTLSNWSFAILSLLVGLLAYFGLRHRPN